MKNFNVNWKIVLFLLLSAAAAPLFAEGLGTLGLGGLETFADTLVGIFTSKIVKAILIMCLCGCAIAYGYNKDNESMKKKVIAIAIAIAIITAAATIVDKLFSAAGK